MMVEVSEGQIDEGKEFQSGETLFVVKVDLFLVGEREVESLIAQGSEVLLRVVVVVVVLVLVVVVVLVVEEEHFVVQSLVEQRHVDAQYQPALGQVLLLLKLLVVWGVWF